MFRSVALNAVQTLRTQSLVESLAWAARRGPFRRCKCSLVAGADLGLQGRPDQLTHM